jgi:hypothetical protein
VVAIAHMTLRDISVPNPPTIQVTQINTTAVNVSWHHNNVDGLPVLGFLLTLKKQTSRDEAEKFDLAPNRKSYVLANLGNI